MPYGTIKVDNIVFTNSGVDQTIGVSGLVQSVSGNLTVTGTISGNLIRGTTVSGATITGSVLSVTSGLFTSGVVGAPTIGFAGDGNTGFWSPAGDTVALSTGGSERIRVDADGDLGVGTTDPTSRLTVRSDATSGPNTIIRVENRAVSAGATTQNIKIEGIFDYNNGTSDASAGAILFGKEGTYTTTTTANDSYLAFETVTDNSSTEKVRINSTGQLITTISGTAAAPAVVMGNDVNTGLYSPGADQLAVATNGTGRLFVDASGNVGIGTTSPGSALSVTSSATTPWFVFRGTTSGYDYGSFLNSAANVIGYLGAGNSAISTALSTDFALRAETNLVFASNGNSERARIDSSGRLLLGTSSESGAAILQVQTPTTLSTTLDKGVNFTNTSAKVYPTTASFNVTPGFQQNLELGTAQTIDTVAPGGFNFVYGQRHLYTKSAGNTQDIERLNFGGFNQSFSWTDANTCKQYIGFADSFGYGGIDANGRTSSSLNTGTLTLAPPDGGTQTITNATGRESIIRAGVGTNTVNITNSVNVTPDIRFQNFNAGTKTTNITNHTFFGTGTFWGVSGATGTVNATITNLYGLRLTSPASSTGLTVTNNWGISQEWGLAKNYLAGITGLGTTTPGGTLDIKAAAATTPLIVQGSSSEFARIDSSGRLLVGTSSARTNIDYALGTTGSQLQIEQANATTNFSIVQNFDSATIGAPAIFTLARSGATSIGSSTIVANNNRVGEINFSGSDGTDFTVAACIRGEVDGTQ